MLGEAEILAEVIRPARSHITAAIASRLAILGATPLIGIPRGYSEEAPAIYITPGRETPTPEYGLDAWAAEYSVVVIVDRTQYTLPDYEVIDRIGAIAHKALMAHADDALSAADVIVCTGKRPGHSEDQGDTIGVELSYTITYSVDPAEFNHAI
ncbi:MAG: hypothetical protein EOM26_11285 [Alphaproteobacteria bacterium]|nr:hypothetical protein [Alphaproteobacteria bacterium]